jgi:ribosome-associated toxin RatA of RatAB toxin-antitoxin module
MPSYGECHSADIDAPPQACFDALTDYERLPEWQSSIRSAHILERDERGRGAVVEYEVDARFRTVRYRLRQVYDEPRLLGSDYLGGDFRDFAGEWRFEPLDGGERTHAELSVRIDPGRLVPGPLRRAISDAVMRRALHDLARHVERAVPS